MDFLETKVNECWDKAVFLRIISAFADEADFRSYLDMTDDIFKFFKSSSDEAILQRLDHLNAILDKDIADLSKIYCPKLSTSEIAANWNTLFKDGNEVYSYGITYGWLEENFELNNFRLYNYVPYQFRLGIGAHKGHFAIEEEGLLKDAFNVLAKAERSYRILQDFGKQQTEKLTNASQKEFDSKTYTKLSDQKYEVSSYSRLTIISFYAFVEAFVNSVGFSYLKRNEKALSIADQEVLLGKKKGRYLMLKSKMELLQKIIRADRMPIMITSDDAQMPESAKAFFNDYEELRNAAVHYSPIKTNIWIKNREWVEKAKHFSTIAMELSLKFWTSCYPEIGLPEYVGELDYNLHYQNAYDRLQRIDEISKGLE